MARPKTANKTVIDKEFAARLEQAFDTSPLIPPYNFGRLAYVQDRLKEQGIVTSRETVRKWLAGEARPRHTKLAALAKVLQADEAWLAFGKTPDTADVEPEARARNLDGAVYYVAGLMGLNRASVAFTDPTDKKMSHTHFHAIVDGRHHSFYIALAKDSNGSRFVIPTGFEHVTVIGVLQRSDLQFDLFRLTTSAISKFGMRKGGFIELTAIDHGNVLKAKTEDCPKLETFRDMLI